MGITCDRCTPSFSRSEFCQTVVQGFGDFTENAGVPESGWIDPDDGEGRHGHALAGFGRQRARGFRGGLSAQLATDHLPRAQ